MTNVETLRKIVRYTAAYSIDTADTLTEAEYVIRINDEETAAKYIKILRPRSRWYPGMED